MLWRILAHERHQILEGPYHQGQEPCLFVPDTFPLFEKADFDKLCEMDYIGRAKYVEEINVDKSYDEIEAEIRKEVAELIRKGADEV